MRPSGAGSITMTNPNYQVYNGVDITVTKRYSNKWQLQAALTIQDNPQYFPEGAVDAHQSDRAVIPRRRQHDRQNVILS